MRRVFTSLASLRCLHAEAASSAVAACLLRASPCLEALPRHWLQTASAPRLLGGSLPGSLWPNNISRGLHSSGAASSDPPAASREYISGGRSRLSEVNEDEEEKEAIPSADVDSDEEEDDVVLELGPVSELPLRGEVKKRIVVVASRAALAAQLEQNKRTPEGGKILNEAIPYPTLRIVFGAGEHKIMSRGEALRSAKDQGLDLILVDPTAVPPVCRFVDYDRVRYLERVKEKEGKKKQSEKQKMDTVKEVRFSARTEEHDLRVKAAQAYRILEEGCRTKVTVTFRNRADAEDKAGRAKAQALLERAVELINGMGPTKGKVDLPPKVDGAMLSLRLVPSKEVAKKPGKKGAAVTAPVEDLLPPS